MGVQVFIALLPLIGMDRVDQWFAIVGMEAKELGNVEDGTDGKCEFLVGNGFRAHNAGTGWCMGWWIERGIVGIAHTKDAHDVFFTS